MTDQLENVLEVDNVCVQIHSNKSKLTITEGVSFNLKEGETLGIVGESGCGKSITALSIIGLLPDNASVTEGSIRLKGKNLLDLSRDEYRMLRGKEISMIFQDPMTSLNPVYTIGFQIAELFKEHTSIPKHEYKDAVIKLLKLVSIPRPEEIINEYPHQLSGGMRQRVMIAMGLACEPELLIADEPTTALDVTIQAQILDIMKNLQAEFNMSTLFITHDLGVVAEICDRVVVMYAGQVVEESSVETMFTTPKHPYTQGLMASIPKIGEHKDKLHSIRGTVPQLDEIPRGCRFADRCSKVMKKCREQAPPMFSTGENTQTRCWLYENSVEMEETK